MPRKKKLSLREYASILNTKCFGLHFRLFALVQSLKKIEAVIQSLPDSEEKGKLIFNLVAAESALNEHDPNVLNPHL